MSVAGYAINIQISSNGHYIPLVRKSSGSADLTLATGGTSVTIPWVQNANSGTGDVTSPRPAEAIQAALRAILDDRAANSDPA